MGGAAWSGVIAWTPSNCSVSLVGMPPYRYTEDLLALSACVPRDPTSLPPQLQGVQTPLRAAQWRAMLENHPDRRFAQYLLEGIENGFKIGFDYAQHSVTPCRNNMLSTLDHPQVVTDYLELELEEGRITELKDMTGVMGLQVSPFGVIPKKGSDQWRLILDLSSPHGSSVNDGISKERCSLAYVSIDEIAKQVVELGRGARMAKMDIKSAYRLVPVHPQDRLLLGMWWNNRIFVDNMLPFGLRSAPKIFTAIADALEWVIKQRGVAQVYHYLDDFVTLGEPEKDTCAHNLRIILQVCEELGVTVALNKCVDSTVCLTFLGIEIDSVNMEMRLPAEKLARLRDTIEQWKGSKSCTKRELLSLIGQLGHACKVVKPGRIFLSQMIKLSTVAKQLDHHIRLNQAFQADLAWWSAYVSQWNGVSLLWDEEAPSAVLTSDASGSWGCGAFWQTHWFQLQWPESLPHLHITVKELIPIVISAAVWGRQWTAAHVRVRFDNAAVVHILNRGYSRDSEVMHLMRCLHFIVARFNFRISAEHIQGTLNTAADALSRDSLCSFQDLMPAADHSPTPIPTILTDILMTTRPDWLSTDWTALFTSI